MFKGILFLGMIMAGPSFAQYEVGQVWQYQTREGEENSLLYIVRIDEIENYGKIYHVYVDNLRVKNKLLPNGFQSELPHAPVSQQTLDDSIIKLVHTQTKMPDISEGYNYWRTAFNSGEGGVFTISIKEIISLIEEISNQHQ